MEQYIFNRDGVSLSSFGKRLNKGGATTEKVLTCLPTRYATKPRISGWVHRKMAPKPFRVYRSKLTAWIELRNKGKSPSSISICFRLTRSISQLSAYFILTPGKNCVRQTDCYVKSVLYHLAMVGFFKGRTPWVNWRGNGMGKGRISVNPGDNYSYCRYS